jgi:hypothetical protein
MKESPTPVGFISNYSRVKCEIAKVDSNLFALTTRADHKNIFIQVSGYPEAMCNPLFPPVEKHVDEVSSIFRGAK